MKINLQKIWQRHLEDQDQGLKLKKKQLKEIKEDFCNLKHRFSKKDADKYRKLFSQSVIISIIFIYKKTL